MGFHPSAGPRGAWSFDSLFFFCSCREALLAEMGVAMREDGGTLGVFSPKKVGSSYSLLPGDWFVPLQLPSDPLCHSWPAPHISLAFSWL